MSADFYIETITMVPIYLNNKIRLKFRVLFFCFDPDDSLACRSKS